MSPQTERERIVALEQQVGRLVSDFTSEKHNHADIHRDMWKAINTLQAFHWKFMGALAAVQVGISVVVAIIMKLIIK